MSNRQEITPKTSFDDLPEWLTVRQAAAYVGLSYWTVHQSVHRGEIPHRRFGPKIIFIPKAYFSAVTQ